MAIRLSKRELTERERVLAWLNNQPFTTSQRVKATVPVLTPAEVREKYSPLDAQATGQFFTPAAMAVAAMRGIEATGLVLDGSILEPCAGLGALLAPLEGKQLQVTAFELNQTCAAIGARLAPWAAWTNDNPFDHLAELEGRFDWVIANPPFNTRWGMASAEEVRQSGATRSEHLFLELALRALKPGGHAAFIAPSTFLTSGVKKFRQWLQENAMVINNPDPANSVYTADGQKFTEGLPLPGEFALTKVSVRLFLFERLDTRTSVPVPALAARPEAVPAQDVPAPAANVPVPLIVSAFPTVVIERKDLQSALALIKMAVSKEALAFRITPAGIELLATHPRCDVYLQLPARVVNAPADAHLFALVPAATFVDLVAVLDGPIALHLAEGSLMVEGGACKSRITLVSGSCSDEILSRIINGERPISLTGNQFASLAYATEAADDDDNRPALAALFLQVEDAMLTAAAADGFMLARRQISIPDAGTKRSVMPQAEMLARVAAKVSKSEEVRLFFQKNGLTLHIPSLGAYYHFWDMAGSFPDYQQVLDNCSKSKNPPVPIDPKRWATFLKRTRSLKCPIVLANIGPVLYAQSDEEHLGCMEDVLGDYPTDAGNAWTVVAWNLLDAIIQIVLKAENVTFQFGSSPRTPVLVQADGLTTVLMPLAVQPEPELVQRQQSGAIPLFMPAKQEESVPA